MPGSIRDRPCRIPDSSLELPARPGSGVWALLTMSGLIKSERFSPRMRREEILVTSVASNCHLSCASGLHAPQGQIPPVPFPSRALGPLSRPRPKFSNAPQMQPQGVTYTKTGFTISLSKSPSSLRRYLSCPRRSALWPVEDRRAIYKWPCALSRRLDWFSSVINLHN